MHTTSPNVPVACQDARPADDTPTEPMMAIVGSEEAAVDDFLQLGPIRRTPSRESVRPAQKPTDVTPRPLPEPETLLSSDDASSPHTRSQPSAAIDSDHPMTSSSSPVEALSPEPETPEEPDVAFVHIELTDGMGYRTGWLKTEDETLDSLLMAYSRYSGIDSRYLLLMDRMTPINRFTPVKDLYIGHLGLVHVDIGLSHLVKMTSHIETAIEAIPPSSNAHMQSSVIEVTLTLQKVWPRVPAITLKRSVPGNITARDLLATVRNQPFFGRRRLMFQYIPHIDSALVHLANPEGKVELAVTRSCLDDPREEILRHTSNYLNIPNRHEIPDHKAITFVIDRVLDVRSPPYDLLQQAYITNDTGTGSALLAWAREAFQMPKGYLYHNFYPISAGSLRSYGFREGYTYTLVLHHQEPPAWLCPPRIFTNRFKRMPYIRIRTPTLAEHRFQIEPSSTVAMVLERFAGEDGAHCRLLIDDEPLPNDKRLHELGPLDERLFDLEYDRTGGRSTRWHRTSVAALLTDREPYPNLVGGQIYQGKLTAAVPGPRRLIPIKLPEGRYVTLVAGPDYSFSKLREYVTREHGANCRIQMFGESLDINAQLKDLDFEDGDEIDLVMEQVGGGPTTGHTDSPSAYEDDDEDEGNFSETTPTVADQRQLIDLPREQEAADPSRLSAPSTTILPASVSADDDRLVPVLAISDDHTSSFQAVPHYSNPQIFVTRTRSPEEHSRPQREQAAGAHTPSAAGAEAPRTTTAAPSQTTDRNLPPTAPAAHTEPTTAPPGSSPPGAAHYAYPPTPYMYPYPYGMPPSTHTYPPQTSVPHGYGQVPFPYSSAYHPSGAIPHTQYGPLPPHFGYGPTPSAPVLTPSRAPPQAAAPPNASHGNEAAPAPVFPYPPYPGHDMHAPSFPTYAPPAPAPQPKTVTKHVPGYPGLKPYSLTEGGKLLQALSRSGPSRLIQRFRGTNAQMWIETYEAVGRKEKATPEELIDHLQFNVSMEDPDIWTHVSQHPAFVAKDWEELKIYLLTGFEGPKHQRYHVFDLENFVDEKRTIETVEHLNTYTNRFQELAIPLKQSGRITPYICVELYIRGLSERIRDKLTLDDSEDELTFEQVVQKVRNIVQPTSFFSRIAQDIERREGRLKDKTATEKPVFALKAVKPQQETTEALAAGFDKIAVTIQQKWPPPSRPPAGLPATPGPQPPRPAGMPIRTPSMQPAQNLVQPTPATGVNTIPVGQRPEGPSICAYCGDPSHWKRDCPVMKEHLDKGWIVNNGNRACYADGRPVNGKIGTYGDLIRSLADSGTLPQASPPVTESHALFLNGCFDDEVPEGIQINAGRTFSEANPEPEGARKRTTLNSRGSGYPNTADAPSNSTTPDNALARPLRNLPRTSTPTPAGSRSTAPPPQVVRFEEPQPPPTPPPSTPATPITEERPESTDEQIEAEEEAPQKIPPLQKRRRTSKLQRLADPEEAARRLLDQEVALTWRDVVGLSPAVQKVILEHLRNELVPLPTTGRIMPWLQEEMQGIVSSINLLNKVSHEAHSFGAEELVGKYFVDQLSHGDEDSDDTSVWYTRALPFGDAEIKGKVINTLFDSGSQVNTIRASLQKALMLPIRTDGSHAVVGAGKNIVPLLGVAENVSVTVGGITVKIHLWVMSESGPELLLGMPALRQLNAELDCSTGYLNIRDDKTGRIAEIPVVHDRDPANTSNMMHAMALTQRSSNKSTSAETMPLYINHIACINPPSEYLLRKPLPMHVNAKAKRVADKVRPTAMPGIDWHEQHLKPIEYDRDPYDTPLQVPPPSFEPTHKLTQERVDQLNFGPPGFIGEEERRLLLHVLRLREKVLAFEDKDRGFLNPGYDAEQRLFMTDHEPWVAYTYPYPKSQYGKIVELLQSYLKAGILEYSTSPYVIPHFCIKKQNGDLRLIFDFSPGNKYLVPDRGIMPFAVDVIDHLVGCVCYFYLDIMTFFHQLLAHETARKYAAIRTPLGLLQPRTVVPGGANSPAWAQKVINHINGEDLLKYTIAFCDDEVGMGPRSRYDEECLPGTQIRRWLFEFAITLERVLYRLEHANLVVSAAKMVVITPEVEIVGVRVSEHGKRLDPSKVDRLQVWPDPCPSQASLRGFLGLANYLRAHIPNMAQMDAPLRALVGKKWGWTPEASKAMQQIKDAARTKEYLTVIDYTSEDPIILSVDSSDIATGFVLAQDRPTGRAIALYDSVAFTEVEQRYSQPKLELCGVYKAVRKLRYHLTGVRFTLEVDAISLIPMINKPDVTTGPMARWIANLKLFDFTIKHVPGKLHVIPDGLSRTSFNNAEAAEDFPEEDPPMRAYNHELPEPHDHTTPPPRESNDQTAPEHAHNPLVLPFLEEQYEGDLRNIGRWLATGGLHPELKDVNRSTRQWLRRQLGRFVLIDGRLFKTNGEEPPLLVLGRRGDQERALSLAHDDNGHRGRDATTTILLRRVWWPTLRPDVITWIRSCHVCQVRDTLSSSEPLKHAPIPRLFEEFALDIVDTGKDTGPRRYLVVARCLLTSWVEARALPNKLASSVAKFIEDEIISRYGPVIKLILTDNGPENSADTAALLERVGLRHAKITPHHPQGNSVVERGHGPLVMGLLKAAYDDRFRTHSYLPQVLWADRITARRTTGKSPFELVYGYEPLLPIDHELKTFAMLEWDLVTTRSDLIAVRARQIRRRDEDLEMATRRLRLARQEGRTYHDFKMANELRDPLPPGTLVLLRSTSTFQGKAEDRWMGPYRVVSQTVTGAYTLEEVDGTRLASTFGPDRLRRYFSRPRKINEVRDFLDPAVDNASPFNLGTPAAIMDEVAASLGRLPDLVIHNPLEPPPATPTPMPSPPADEHPLVIDNDLPVSIPPSPAQGLEDLALLADTAAMLAAAASEALPFANDLDTDLSGIDPPSAAPGISSERGGDVVVPRDSHVSPPDSNTTAG